MSNTKTIKLRAFNVSNETLTSSRNSLFEQIISALAQRHTISDRLMLLNQDSKQSYVLANSETGTQNNYIFGLVLDVTPYENGGELSKELLNETSINLSQVTQARENSLLCQDHFYFLLTPNLLIANCKRSSIISKLQTYLNWLIDDVRGDLIMSFAPIIETVTFVEPKEIRSLEIGNVKMSIDTSTGIKTLDVKKFLSGLFNEVPELEALRNNEILQAFLTLKFKRPSKMTPEKFATLIGDFAKSVETSDSIKITNKKGRTITGSQIEKNKAISINCTIEGLIVEQELKLAMQQYIQEIQNEHKE